MNCKHPRYARKGRFVVEWRGERLKREPLNLNCLRDRQWRTLLEMTEVPLSPIASKKQKEHGHA